MVGPYASGPADQPLVPDVQATVCGVALLLATVAMLTGALAMCASSATRDVLVAGQERGLGRGAVDRGSHQAPYPGAPGGDLQRIRLKVVTLSKPAGTASVIAAPVKFSGVIPGHDFPRSAVL
jgi:hypothetical protein